MEPTKKAPAIELLLSGLTRKPRTLTIRGGGCMTCGKTGIVAESFRDDLSKKEYSISGMCQSCQDDIFGISEE